MNSVFFKNSLLFHFLRIIRIIGDFNFKELLFILLLNLGNYKRFFPTFSFYLNLKGYKRKRKYKLHIKKKLNYFLYSFFHSYLISTYFSIILLFIYIYSKESNFKLAYCTTLRIFFVFVTCFFFLALWLCPLL